MTNSKNKLLIIFSAIAILLASIFSICYTMPLRSTYAESAEPAAEIYIPDEITLNPDTDYVELDEEFLYSDNLYIIQETAISSQSILCLSGLDGDSVYLYVNGNEIGLTEGDTHEEQFIAKFPSKVIKFNGANAMAFYFDSNIVKNALNTSDYVVFEPPYSGSSEMAYSYAEYTNAMYIIKIMKEIDLTPPVEEAPEDDDKLEGADNWLSNAGDSISKFISDNLGVTIGSTLSLVLVVAVAIIIIKKLK